MWPRFSNGIINGKCVPYSWGIGSFYSWFYFTIQWRSWENDKLMLSVYFKLFKKEIFNGYIIKPKE